MSFAYALLALNLLATRQVPPGTQLHIRLLTPIGSYASRAGDPVRAVLIAPVLANGQVILPEGSLLAGSLKRVQRVGLGFIHENAALDLEFTSIAPPDGASLALSSRVQEVDTGRERVTRDGSIRGVRTTSSLSYRTGGYIRTALQWEIHAEIAVWAIKALVVQVPEPELYYPAGVELTLGLTRPVTITEAATEPGTGGGLSAEERANMAVLVADLPNRTHTSATNRPSDLINLMFIGSREQLETAFETAGWTRPETAGLRANIRRIRAVAEGHGDMAAPMSDLLVQDLKAEMSWQKGFNDISKRHHIRIWKQPATWDGREVWIGAATRDIDFAYFRPGRTMTHKIGEDVDQERDKVVNDLVFTSCAKTIDNPERAEVPGFTRNATGDPMRTDTRLAVVRLTGCEKLPDFVASEAAPSDLEPAQFGAAEMGSTQPADPALARHGRGVQRFFRREILCFRSDLLRENLYWRSYEGIRWMITAARNRRIHTDDPTPAYPSTYELGQSTTSRSRIVRDMLQ